MSNVDERTLRGNLPARFRNSGRRGRPVGVHDGGQRTERRPVQRQQVAAQRCAEGRNGVSGTEVTDFCHSRSTEKAALAGLDIDMPWGDFRDDQIRKLLMDAVARGDVPQSVLDEMVRRILWVKWKTGMLDHKDMKAGAAPQYAGESAGGPPGCRREYGAAEKRRRFAAARYRQDEEGRADRAPIAPSVSACWDSAEVRALRPCTRLRRSRVWKPNRRQGRLGLPAADRGLEFQPIPNECWVGKDGRNGVTAVYRKQGSGDVQQERIEPVVDFTWFNASPVPGKSSPDTCMLPSKVSSKLPLPETIPLRLITDDHAELWVSDMGPRRYATPRRASRSAIRRCSSSRRARPRRPDRLFAVARRSKKRYGDELLGQRQSFAALGMGHAERCRYHCRADRPV